MRRAAGAVSVAVALAGVLAGCSGSDEPSGSTATSSPPAQASSPSPSSTTVEGSSVEVTGPLSYTVWSAIVSGFVGSIPTSSPLYPVTAVEDVSSGTIRVFVQEQLSSDQKTTVGRQMFTLGAFSNTDLKTVVVRDASGVDTNVQRSSIPGLKQ